MFNITSENSPVSIGGGMNRFFCARISSGTFIPHNKNRDLRKGGPGMKKSKPAKNVELIGYKFYGIPSDQDRQLELKTFGCCRRSGT